MAKDIIKTMRENSKKGIIGYASNVTKSIGYASFEKLKKMNPAVAEIDQSNNEIFKTIYKDTINYRTTYKRSMTAIKKSKFYEAADIGFNALKEDLMTGNFYNKQREQEIEDKQMEKFMSNDSFDLDFDEGNNDYTDVDGSNVKPLNSNAEVIGNMNANSAANANTISMSVLRSAQAQSEVSIKNTQLLHTFNIKAFGQVNANLDAINSNMGSMMKYLDNNISSHLSNSQQFFEAVTPMLQDQTALLRQIVENTKPPEPKKNDNKNERTTFYDIAGAEGTPDFDLYAKQISKNVMNLIDENTMGMGGLLNSMGDDVNILSSFAANPYGLMMDLMMDKLTPKQIEKGFNELNKSIGGFFGSFITKMNTYTKSDNPLLATIGKILGVSTNRKNYIDTSKYDKNKVDWNGKSEKALTEIIPNKLEQIISILSGSEEKTYDYEKGQYMYLSDLQKDYDRFSDSFWKSASRDIMDEMTTLMNQNIAFETKKQRDQLYEDMKSVFKKLYEDNELLDINNKDLSKDYMDYNVSTEDNMRILQTLMQNVPRSQWHLFNKEINNTYKNERDSYERVEY